MGNVLQFLSEWLESLLKVTVRENKVYQSPVQLHFVGNFSYSDEPSEVFRNFL